MIKQGQQGFTLVEIMVALAIGLFLTAGALQIFITTKGSNRIQENLSRMQENARFAMHFLTEDIRQAGFAGGICGGEFDVIQNAYNNLDATSASYAITHDFAAMVPISGAEGTGLNGSDSITVSRMANLGIGFDLKSQMPTPAATLQVQASSGIQQYSIALVTDCDKADIFEVTNIPASGAGASGNDEVKHTGGAVAQGPGNKSGSLSTVYGTTSRLYILSGPKGYPMAMYDIQSDTAGVPGLRKNGDQLVANIENMQILYGEKLGNNMHYVPANAAGLDIDNVVSVKVSLLVRSPDDNVASAPQTYTFNGMTTTPTDRRLRKVYTSTITVRNQMLKFE